MQERYLLLTKALVAACFLTAGIFCFETAYSQSSDTPEVNPRHQDFARINIQSVAEAVAMMPSERRDYRPIRVGSKKRAGRFAAKPVSVSSSVRAGAILKATEDPSGCIGKSSSRRGPGAAVLATLAPPRDRSRSSGTPVVDRLSSDMAFIPFVD
jgi:hypothetical protein